jgi:hypothetical protein
VDDTAARRRCQIQERSVDHSLQQSARPGRPAERIELLQRFQNACSRAIQANVVVGIRSAQIELDVHLAEAARDSGQLVQQLARKLTGLDRKLLARGTVDYPDSHARLPDPLAQL